MEKHDSWHDVNMTHDRQHKHNLILSPSVPFQTFNESNLPLDLARTWMSYIVFLFTFRLAYLTFSFKKQTQFQRINQGCKYNMFISAELHSVLDALPFSSPGLFVVGRHGRWTWLAPAFIFSFSLLTNFLIQAFLLLSDFVEV